MAGGFNGILGLTVWRFQSPAAAPTPPPPTPSIPTGGGGNRIGHTGRSGRGSRGHEVLPPGWFDRFDPADLAELQPRVYRQRTTRTHTITRRVVPALHSRSECRVRHAVQAWRASGQAQLASVLGTAVAQYHRHYTSDSLARLLVAELAQSATMNVACSSTLARHRGCTATTVLLPLLADSTTRHRFRDDPQLWAMEWAAATAAAEATAAAMRGTQATQEAIAAAKRQRVCDRQRREDKLLLDDGDLFGL